MGKRSSAELEADASLEPKKMKLEGMKKVLQDHGADVIGSKKALQERLSEVKGRAAAEAYYQAKTIAQLKAVLESNSQLKGGTKQELVDRCVDGKLFGKLPRCPQCGGGVLRVVYETRLVMAGEARSAVPATTMTTITCAATT